MFDGVSSSLLVAEVESWRQYVPLAVSGLVILDIALGSPAANAILGKVMKPPTEDDFESGKPTTNPKERVDSKQVAQAALDKASSSLELRKFLDERKTDYDKMEDLKRKMDEDMEKFDNRKISTK